jgi:hypothetical protein
MFNHHLVTRYKDEEDCHKDHDATSKKKKQDILLLALGIFRVLARDLLFDNLEDLTGISEAANHHFFYEFALWIAAQSSEYIVLPRTADELAHVMDLWYIIVGLPGCADSADCVHHVFWDACPAPLQSSRSKGMEKYPTLVFEVVVSHTKKILLVSGVQCGTDNDKQFRDPMPQSYAFAKMVSDILKESSFKHYLEDGSEAEEKGYYYIVDGGYNIWIELIAPFKHEPESCIAHIWSKQVESIWKDVECVFGILKKWFLILKHPVLCTYERQRT